MSISRRRLLCSAAAVAAVPFVGDALLGRVHAEPSTKKRNLVLVVASGGWDVSYALDPKPNAADIDVPSGEVRMFGDLPIYVDPSRPATTAFFEAFSGNTVVVNGIEVNSIAHEDCAKRILTGTLSDKSPDFATLTAWEHGRDLPAPYLVLGQTSYSGPHAAICIRAGTANQIGTLLNPAAALPVVGEDFLRFHPDDHELELIRSYVESRAAREQAIRGQVGSNQRRLEDFMASMQRADELRAFNALGDLNVTRTLDVQVDLALAALSQGLSHTVQIEMGGWDTHEDNARQRERHEELFANLLVLIDRLASTPGHSSGKVLLDDTVVVVVSEMSRTPRLNLEVGKDHWPVTSALVVGSGVRGQRVIGGTDALAQALPIDYASGRPDAAGRSLQYDNFVAGALNLVGVDASTHLPGVVPLDALQA